MSSLSLMKHVCTIQRAISDNVDGELIPNWTDHATGISCLLQEGAGRLRQSKADQALFYDAILFLPPGTDVKPQATDDSNDRIVMTIPARVSGVKYLVQFAADESGQGDHLVAYLNRIPA